eukprot:9078926-Alexandrium_andersonii.AAC.1
MREFPRAADVLLMDAEMALLHVPAPHRCEAARRYAWHAGRADQERLNIPRKVCSGVVDEADLHQDQDCLLYLLPSSIKGSL